MLDILLIKSQSDLECDSWEPPSMNIKVYNLGISELGGQLITTSGRRQEIHKSNGEYVIMYLNL